MSLPSSINIYTLKQIRTKHHRYDFEDCRITSPSVCYKLLQILLDLESEPGRVELQYATLKKEHMLF